MADKTGRGLASPAKVRAGTWVLWEALPRHLLENETVQARLPELTNLNRELARLRRVPSNLYGIETVANVPSNIEILAPRLQESIRLKAARANSYVEAIRNLSDALKLGSAWGPSLIHSIVDSEVTYGDGRYQPPATISTPVMLSVSVTIDPVVHYYSGAEHPGVGLVSLGPDLPSAWWRTPDDDEHEVTLSVRSLVDAKRSFERILRRFSQLTGMPLRQTRPEAFKLLGRNVRWYYLNHCEGQTAGQIADAEQTEEHTPDESVVLKGIAQVDALLAAVRVL